MVHSDSMSTTDRLLLALAIVLVDLLLFALPLTGLVAAWVLITRPPVFREWVERLYADDAVKR